MKNKIGIASLLIVILEFIGFLIWGFNIDPVDAMGYGLIVIYVILPLTAFVLSLILSLKKSAFILPMAVLAILSHIFLPFLVYGTFEIAVSICLSAIPFGIGWLTGYIINQKRRCTNEQTTD